MVFDQLRDLIREDRDRPSIVANGVTETFRLYHERPLGIKERLYKFRRSSYTDFNALEDVSFSINPGETVGIIGPNGSGKSTMLKVLVRILEPDEGTIEMNGRVASLLELGAGFHGDLSGRENIFLNAAILGLTRAETQAQFENIVEFAGVRPFLDTPVRNYSSGMYVRLGFAIAVHVNPDILIVDEVLSVGDARFQAKSLGRIREFQEAGKTVVFVSHDMRTVEEMCDRVIVLRDGRVRFDGPAREGVQLYGQTIAAAADDIVRPSSPDQGTGALVVSEVALFDPVGGAISSVKPSAPMTLKVGVRAREDVGAASVGIIVRTGDGRHIYEAHTTWQGLGVGPLEAGQTASLTFGLAAHLLAGHYSITVVTTTATGRVTHDTMRDAVFFEVEPAPGSAGLVDLRSSMRVADGPALNLDVDPELRSDELTVERARELHPSRTFQLIADRSRDMPSAG